MLSPIEQEVIARGRAGETARQIADDLKRRSIRGWGISKIGQFLRAQIGARRAGRPPTPDFKMPADDAAPPEDDNAELLARLAKSDESAAAVVGAASTIEELQRLHAFIHKHMLDAERVGNVAMVSTLSARALAVLGEIRKATPPEPPDLNSNPDYLAMAAQVEKRLFRLVDAMIEKP
jgi:hypothetical protein